MSFKCHDFQGFKIVKVLRQGKFCECALNCLLSHFIVSLWIDNLSCCYSFELVHNQYWFRLSPLVLSQIPSFKTNAHWCTPLIHSGIWVLSTLLPRWLLCCIRGMSRCCLAFEGWPLDIFTLRDESLFCMFSLWIPSHWKLILDWCFELSRVRMKQFNYGPNMYEGCVSSHVELFSITYKCLMMIVGSPNWK